MICESFPRSFCASSYKVYQTLYFGNVGFAVWIDSVSGLAWAQGTHEYRPWGAAVIADTDQFRPRDFRQQRRRPEHLQDSFVGFVGSLEEVNARLRSRSKWKPRATPAHLL
jgi:hypothetical protein